MAPPGNQAVNRENKLQPIAMEDPGLLDKSHDLGSWQVGLRETSASEPIQEASKDEDDVKTGLLYWVRDKFGRNLFSAQAASSVNTV